MDPQTEALVRRKKEQIKLNEIEIEALAAQIAALEKRKDGHIVAKIESIEYQINLKTELRKKLIEQNKIDATIVLSMMK
jgi:hypothetical protein